MKTNETNKAVSVETEDKIAVIEQALLKNVIGGAGTDAGEFSAHLRPVECTGK
jgi:hypothetical protein